MFVLLIALSLIFRSPHSSQIDDAISEPLKNQNLTKSFFIMFRKTDAIIETIVKEANSTAGTWSLSVIRVVQQMQDQFKDESVKKLFEEIHKNLSTASNAVSVYKWAQLFSLMHHAKFPGFEAFYQENVQFIFSVVESFQTLPLGQVAKGLLEKLPIKAKIESICPITSSKSLHFIPVNETSSLVHHKKERITCCSPPPTRAI